MAAELRTRGVPKAMVAKRPVTRLSALPPLRTSERAKVGSSVTRDERMPNGDPPSVMLWGDE